MKIKYLALALIVFSGPAFGQTAHEIILKGKVPARVRQTISVFEYEDFFTRTRLETQNTIIGEDGAFFIKRPLDRPLYLDIVLNKNTTGIYVQPGFVYELVFDQAGLVTQVVSKDKINAISKDFDGQRGKLWEAYHDNDTLYIPKLKEFVAQQSEEIKGYGEFAKTIIGYRLGMIEIFLCLKETPHTNAGMDRLERDLLLNKPVNYSTPDYFQFLREYSAWRPKVFRRTAYLRNYEKALLYEAQAIPNEVVSQLAALYMLENDLQMDRRMPKDRINTITDSLAHAALTPQVRKSAELFLRKNNALSTGAEIKDFAFDTYQGQSLRLSSFRNKKYVLIDFWFVGCSSCIANFPSLKQLKEAYPDKIEIVSLTSHDSKDRIAAFLKKRPQFQWLFSPIDTRSELLNYFNVVYYPTYYLIGPDGKLVAKLKQTEEEDILKSVGELIR